MKSFMLYLYLRVAGAFILVLLLALLAACDSTTLPEQHRAPVELAVQAHLGSNTVNKLAVEVTAEDIPVPIIVNLTLQDTDSDGDYDRAEGTITVPAGRDRTFTARAFGEEGSITHEGSVTTHVRPNDEIVRIPLYPKAAGVPIEVVMSTYTITLAPASAQLDLGDTRQFVATVTGGNGEPVENPELSWASSNPVVATVDGAGLVTAHVQGRAYIGVSYKGIAAEAEVTVGEAPVPAVTGAIAFVSDRDGNNEIYTMNLDGTGVARLTNNAAEAIFPDWSPDGSKILYWSDRDGDREVYVMNADGTGQTNVSNNPNADEFFPTWRP